MNCLDIRRDAAKISEPTKCYQHLAGPDHNASFTGGRVMADSQPSCQLPVVQGVEFRWIPSWPGYCAGDDGTVWSCRRMFWKKLNTATNGRGYLRVSLYRGNSVAKSVSVASVVLEAFCGTRPKGMQCCHGNGIKTDNRPCNLRWGTASENEMDKVLHGTAQRGERHGSAKLTEAEVIEMLRRRRDYGESISSLGRRFGVSESLAWKIVNRDIWRHIPDPIPEQSTLFTDE